jgi:hypothetical protein
LSLWGVAASEQASRSATSNRLYGRLQQHGLAPATPGERANQAIGQVLKGLSDKEAKKASKIESYYDFAKMLRETKVLTWETSEEDPDMYWAMQWLSTGVSYLHQEYGWGVAGLYYHKVMKAWTSGFLHIETLVLTEEFRRGDLAGGLHQASFFVAVQQGMAKTSGSRRKGGDGDTWCNNCALWFPKAKLHDTKSCKKAKNKSRG